MNGVVIGVVVWIVCGALAYAMTLAAFIGQAMTFTYTREQALRESPYPALFVGMMGPFGVAAMLLLWALEPDFRCGLRWRL